MIGDRLIIPVTGGIAVYTPDTGNLERVIPVDRGDVSWPIVPSVVGTTVIEQRGHTVVALGAAP
jgi:hypothetical protein